jgi:hypothetical protein
MWGGSGMSGSKRSPDTRKCDICGELLVSDKIKSNHDMLPVRIGVCNKSFHGSCLRNLPVVGKINGRNARKCPNSEELFTEPF